MSSPVQDTGTATEVLKTQVMKKMKGKCEVSLGVVYKKAQRFHDLWCASDKPVAAAGPGALQSHQGGAEEVGPTDRGGRRHAVSRLFLVLCFERK